MELGQIYLPAQAGSTGLDVWGNPLKNEGGLVHNDFEGSIIENSEAWQLLNRIVGADAHSYLLQSEPVNGNGKYLSSSGFYIQYEGGYWMRYMDGGIETGGVASTAPYPPKTGYSDGFYIEYDMFGIEDDGTPTELSMADYLAFKNGTQNTLLKWKKTRANNTCLLPQVIRYTQGTTDSWTKAQHDQAVRWAGDPTCGDGMVDFLDSAVTFNGVAVVHNGVDVVYNEV